MDISRCKRRFSHCTNKFISFWVLRKLTVKFNHSTIHIRGIRDFTVVLKEQNCESISLIYFPYLVGALLPRPIHIFRSTVFSRMRTSLYHLLLVIDMNWICMLYIALSYRQHSLRLHLSRFWLARKTHNNTMDVPVKCFPHINLFIILQTLEGRYGVEGEE